MTETNQLTALQHEQLESLSEQVIRLAEENAKLRRDMQYIVCAFCAKEYPKGETAQATAEVMAAHMAGCEQHPMRKAVIENMKLLDACRNALYLLGHDKDRALMPDNWKPQFAWDTVDLLREICRCS